MSGDREQVMAEALVRANAVLNSYEVCGQLWHDLNATLSPAMAALDAAAVSTPTVSAVEAVVNAIDDEHEQTRYCREGACDMCGVIERLNAALRSAAAVSTGQPAGDWPCDDYKAPLTCYTVPNGPKHLTCGGCRQAFPNGPEVQPMYGQPDGDTGDSDLRSRIEALIGGPTAPTFLSDRPNKIFRVQHRDDSLGATITESMVKVRDIEAALATQPDPADTSETAHRALSVHRLDGLQFVKCSCGVNPTPHVWVGPEHYGGVEADGWDALDGVVAAQGAATKLSTKPDPADHSEVRGE